MWTAGQHSGPGVDPSIPENLLSVTTSIGCKAVNSLLSGSSLLCGTLHDLVLRRRCVRNNIASFMTTATKHGTQHLANVLLTSVKNKFETKVYFSGQGSENSKSKTTVFIILIKKSIIFRQYFSSTKFVRRIFLDRSSILWIKAPFLARKSCVKKIKMKKDCSGWTAYQVSKGLKTYSQKLLLFFPGVSDEWKEQRYSSSIFDISGSEEIYQSFFLVRHALGEEPLCSAKVCQRTQRILKCNLNQRNEADIKLIK